MFLFGIPFILYYYLVIFRKWINIKMWRNNYTKTSFHKNLTTLFETFKRNCFPSSPIDKIIKQYLTKPNSVTTHKNNRELAAIILTLPPACWCWAAIFINIIFLMWCFNSMEWRSKFCPCASVGGWIEAMFCLIDLRKSEKWQLKYQLSSVLLEGNKQHFPWRFCKCQHHVEINSRLVIGTNL